MGLSILQVDAFTNRPFAGNPAAVCVLPEAKDAGWMQAIAQEMNLSETAFLLQQEDGFSLRWFTPMVEVDLCGHATLASAHALWTEGYLSSDQIARFHTRSGLLTARQTEGWIELDFPANAAAATAPPPGLLEALGSGALWVGKSRFDYLVEVDSEATVRQLQPDMAQLRSLPIRGVIATSRADAGSEFEFVSRFFAPGSGIDEDPVTGSAHCTLAPYWSERLDKTDFLAYQASPRGGVLKVGLRGDRVLLKGQATTVLRAELLV
ncbi:MAG: PhzF family phenazine biosynthesis protein [Kaiparowitsia implicata GSE-PSE-MK54-09C]|jgi:predicted PhzF superfamily epimerase YddE/YHI9|nr:PhzF family phenazine biosynthesis protein [Kaiparowitsia implicata GSE-PSE-MK54-09C]